MGIQKITVILKYTVTDKYSEVGSCLFMFGLWCWNKWINVYRR